MSGPKHTGYRPSPRRLARRQLAPLAAALGAARASLQELPDQRNMNAADDLERALQSLRAELAKFQGSPDDRAAMLDALRTAEHCRARLAAESRSAPSKQDLDAALTEIDGLLSGSLAGSIDALAAKARALIDQLARDAALEGEAKRTLETVNRLLAAASSATLEAERATRELLEAAKAAIDAEAHALAVEDQALLALGSLDRSKHAAALDSARQQLNAGEHEEAAKQVEAARSLRTAARLAGLAVRTKIEMRDELAGHLASTLRAKNYDECHAYLKAGSGGDERPLVIYANNPSGKAHVRITLPLNDEMTIEVDGVADGEEEICVDVLESFQRALEATGDGMDMFDPGRAASFMTRASERMIERGRQREREK